MNKKCLIKLINQNPSNNQVWNMNRLKKTFRNAPIYVLRGAPFIPTDPIYYIHVGISLGIFLAFYILWNVWYQYTNNNKKIQSKKPNLTDMTQDPMYSSEEGIFGEKEATKEKTDNNKNQRK
jgi:hypothetical protein